MARYKRYFPCSHEINRDPELWEITDQYGDRAMRFVLEIFSLIDLKENHLPITPKLMNGLARMLRMTPAKCWPILGQMVANGWLSTGQEFAIGQSIIVTARNYAQYHRSRSVIGNQLGNQNGNFGGEGISSLNSSLHSLKKNKNLRKEKKDQKKPKPTLTTWPEGFCLTDHLRSYAVSQGVHDPDGEFENFHTHALAKNYKYADWERAFMAWCRSPYFKNKEEFI